MTKPLCVNLMPFATEPFFLAFLVACLVTLYRAEED
jgi:hypothetical protein